MGCPVVAHMLPVRSPREAHGMLAVCAWVAAGLSWGCPWVVYGLHRVTRGWPTGSPRVGHGVLLIFCWVDPWVSCGTLVDNPWDTRGLPVSSQRSAGGNPMGIPWVARGYLMGSPRVNFRCPTGSLWVLSGTLKQIQGDSQLSVRARCVFFKSKILWSRSVRL